MLLIILFYYYNKKILVEKYMCSMKIKFVVLDDVDIINEFYIVMFENVLICKGMLIFKEVDFVRCLVYLNKEVFYS